MTRKYRPAGPLAAPDLVFDPDIPQDVRDLIRAQRPGHSITVGNPWVAVADPLPLLAGAAVVTFLMTRVVPDDAFPTALAVLWLAVLAVSAVWAGVAVASGKRDQSRERQRAAKLRDARGRYVRGSDLTEAAGQLLARANNAAMAVCASTMHRRDLIDRQRNEAVLPRQLWDIAETLGEYSRLVKAEPDQAKGKKIASVLDARRKALRTSLAGVERRVEALEVYAKQVAEADRQYAEFEQIQHIAAGKDEVLDLLARTVRDDLAIAEIDGMTGEAAIVAASFAAALDSAKGAAVIALPAV
ncbi:hypothetical protein [Streptomyces violascens]|uniref:hypothetical protein n=1 Tax=Streptomyces violascens TaxID=67381 RepID=UPI0036A7634E